MADVVWAVWGVYEEHMETFDTHVLAPEDWPEARVIEAAAAAFERRGDEDGLETAKMLRATGEATPLIEAHSDRHSLQVVYDPEARPHRLRVIEAWDDVELHLGDD